MALLRMCAPSLFFMRSGPYIQGIFCGAGVVESKLLRFVRLVFRGASLAGLEDLERRGDSLRLLLRGN